MKSRTEDIKQTRVLLAIGGLIHDLGKVMLRGMDEQKKKSLFPQLGKEEKYKDTFHYAHAYCLWEFLLKGSKFLDLKINPLENPLILASSFHHKPEGMENFEELKDYKLFARIYQKADHFSSSERSKKIREVEGTFLRSIFQDVKLPEKMKPEIKKESEEKERREFFYKLKPLSLDEDIMFPISLGEKESLPNELKDHIKLYNKHWKDFSSELKEILSNFVNYEKLLINLYHLFYRYFWCVPASTFDPERKEQHYPDISLFDHMRTTAALAASFYTEYNLEKMKTSKEDDLKLVFVKGDLTGIQKYLYQLMNIKGVTKRLRGKSFVLGVLPELIARAMLKELGYPLTNIIFAGGGNFEVVIGYEEGITEKLEEFNERIEKVFFEKFGGVLGLTLGYVEISCGEFKSNGYSSVSEKLEKNISIRKKTKFSHLLVKNDLNALVKLLNPELEDLERKTLVRCRSCHQNLAEEKEEEEKNLCEMCKTLGEIGKKLIEAKYLIFSSAEIPLIGVFFNDLGGIYLASDIKEVRSDKEGIEIYCLNNTDFVSFKADGFKFVAKEVPIKEGDVMLFEDLVKLAEGDEKLAFARADVDNLGLIFMYGLGEDYSLSRVATLSRSLDLFFSGYLNWLFTRDNFKNKIYTVYAGGDDLFIVGPWNVIFDVMKDIYSKFKTYTCNNKDFNISCGIFTGRDTYPLRFAAEKSKKAEDKAKDEKPAICALDETLKWDEFGEALKEGDEMAEILRKGNIGRSLFYKFYLLLRNYRELEIAKKPEKYKFYPLFHYYLYRNVKSEDLQAKIKGFLLDIQNSYEVRKDALFRAKYVIMKTRT